MGQGLEVFVADGGEILQAHAAEYAGRLPFPAVDGDLVAALHQARGKLLGEGFEAAVAGGNAACAEERDSHYVFAVSERESRRAIFLGACWLTGAYWNQLAMYSSSTRRFA